MNNRKLSTRTIAKYVAVVVILLTCLGASTQAATLTVTNTNDSGSGSLRGAIASAASGDIIVFDTAGVFATPQTITLTSGELTLDKSLTIDGPGPNQLTINANGASRVFLLPGLVAYASNIVALEGLTISGGDASAGGGIYLGTSTLTITNASIVANNATTAGGGIYNLVGTLTVINSTIAFNTGSSVAGIYNQFGTMTLANSTVSGNFANTNGGGLTNGGTLTITNSTISNNAALTSGGGIYSAGTETLNNTIVAGNFAGVGPGDIFGTIDIANYNLIGDALSSGGITNGVNGNKVGNAGVGTLDINTVLDSALEYNGGATLSHALKLFSPAIDAGSNALAAGLTTDQRGGGFLRVADGNGDNTPVVDIGAYELWCPALVTNTNDSGPGSLRQTIADTCPDATITFDTAGVFSTPQTITLTSGELVIDKNLTIVGPGANRLVVSGNNNSRVVLVRSTTSLNGLTISNGNGSGGHLSGLGGGIYNIGRLTLTNTTVSGNSGDGGAGLLNSGILTLINSTVSGNVTSGSGGGIYNIGSATIINSTLSGNSADQGGAIWQLPLGGPTSISSSTITGNRADSDGSGGGDGGGILASVGTLDNSIVAGNFRGTGTTPDDISGSVTVANNTLIGDAATSGGITNGVNGNKVGFAISDVLNTTLAYNGGPTKTHALVCGGPAIDAGSNAHAVGLTNDQRGTTFARTADLLVSNSAAGSGIDIGSFELQDADLNGIGDSCDATPPVITPGVTGTLGNNGWYITNVQVSWTVTDAESPLSMQTGCDPQTVSSDTNGVTFTCEATSAGGTSSQSVTIKRDATAPIISAAATTASNGAGWYKTDVEVQFTCADSQSGLSGACPANQTLSAEGSAASSTAQTVTDAAGNTSSPSNVVTVKIDKTIPTLNPVVSPNPVQLNGSATATSGAADSLSGLASQSCDAVVTTSTGAKSVTCYASDNAGNTTSASANYTVQSGFNFTGFFSPVDNLPTINNANAGQAIPLKFALGGYQGMNIFAPGYPASAQIPCTSNEPGDDIEETVNPGGSSLTFDAASQRYSYTWKTEKSWKGTCRMLVVRLSDGTDHFAKFKFK